MTLGARLTLKLPAFTALLERGTTNIAAARELDCSRSAVATMTEYLNYNGFHIRQTVHDHGIVAMVMVTGEGK
jgi:hypothetical protein